jgi:hypothetical protein
MNQTMLMTLGRAAITATLVLCGLGLASAEEGQAPSQAKAAAIRPSVVPSPKGDGSQMNPMRRTQNVDRQKAALSLMERRKAIEAASTSKDPISR